jgi:hypothetical protein
MSVRTLSRQQISVLVHTELNDRIMFSGHIRGGSRRRVVFGQRVMDPQDLLLTTAELAVAFAGFASLVGVFSQRRTGKIDRDVANPLRVMLDYSLITLFSSLGPFLPMISDTKETVVWQLSSALWIGGILIYTFLNRSWLREVYVDTYLRPGPRLVVQFLDWASAIAMLGNALGVFWTPSFLVYYAVLLWFLGGAAIGFVQVVASTWREAAAQPNEADVE